MHRRAARVGHAPDLGRGARRPELAASAMDSMRHRLAQEHSAQMRQLAGALHDQTVEALRITSAPCKLERAKGDLVGAPRVEAGPVSARVAREVAAGLRRQARRDAPALLDVLAVRASERDRASAGCSGLTHVTAALARAAAGLDAPSAHDVLVHLELLEAAAALTARVAGAAEKTMDVGVFNDAVLELLLVCAARCWPVVVAGKAVAARAEQVLESVGACFRAWAALPPCGAWLLRTVLRFLALPEQRLGALWALCAVDLRGLVPAAGFALSTQGGSEPLDLAVPPGMPTVLVAAKECPSFLRPCDALAIAEEGSTEEIGGLLRTAREGAERISLSELGEGIARVVRFASTACPLHSALATRALDALASADLPVWAPVVKRAEACQDAALSARLLVVLHGGAAGGASLHQLVAAQADGYALTVVRPENRAPPARQRLALATLGHLCRWPGGPSPGQCRLIAKALALFLARPDLDAASGDAALAVLERLVAQRHVRTALLWNRDAPVSARECRVSPNPSFVLSMLAHKLRAEAWASAQQRCGRIAIAIGNAGCPRLADVVSLPSLLPEDAARAEAALRDGAEGRPCERNGALVLANACFDPPSRARAAPPATGGVADVLARARERGQHDAWREGGKLKRLPPPEKRDEWAHVALRAKRRKLAEQAVKKTAPSPPPDEEERFELRRVAKQAGGPDDFARARTGRARTASRRATWTTSRRSSSPRTGR